MTYRKADFFTGIETSRYSIRITRVDEPAGIVEGNDGSYIFDLMGNEIASPRYARHDPAQRVPAELQIGKKWTAAWRVPRHQGGEDTWELNLAIAAREVVRVSGFDFDAFRIEARGILRFPNGNARRLEQRYWVVPGLNFQVKGEYLAYTLPYTVPAVDERHEIVSLRQQKVGQLAEG